MNLHTLSLIYSYNETSSNLALSCKDLRNYCWRNGLKIKTSKRDITLDNRGFMRQLGATKEDCIAWAAYKGDLKLLRKIGGGIESIKKARYKVSEYAGKSGNLRVIKWLWFNGCCATDTLIGAASISGHLKVIKFFGSKFKVLNFSNSIHPAFEGDQLHIVRWIIDNNKCNRRDLERITEFAVENGKLDFLEWLKSQDKLILRDDLCISAAKNRDIKMLKWLGDNGVVWDESISSYIASYGQLDDLKWMSKNGIPFGPGVCENLAFIGHLEGLKWARNNDYPWNEWTCAAAVSEGCLDCLRWARKNGCPWNEEIRQAALEIGYTEN